MKSPCYFILLFLILCLMPQKSWAADDESKQKINTLFVWETDGKMQSYVFFEDPVITFTTHEIVVTMGMRQEKLPLSQLAHFTYGYTDMSGLQRVEGSKAIQVCKGDAELIVSNLMPGHTAQILDVSGIVLTAQQVDSEGVAHLSLSSLSEGAYIFCIDGFTYKFVK